MAQKNRMIINSVSRAWIEDKAAHRLQLGWRRINAWRNGKGEYVVKRGSEEQTFDNMEDAIAAVGAAISEALEDVPAFEPDE